LKLAASTPEEKKVYKERRENIDATAEIRRKLEFETVFSFTKFLFFTPKKFSQLFFVTEKPKGTRKSSRQS